MNLELLLCIIIRDNSVKVARSQYVPSTCTPFYLLTEVLPVLLVGLPCEMVESFLSWRTLRRAARLSARARRRVADLVQLIRLFPSTKAKDLRCSLRLGTFKHGPGVFRSVVNSEVKALHTCTESCHVFMFPHQLSV